MTFPIPAESGRLRRNSLPNRRSRRDMQGGTLSALDIDLNFQRPVDPMGLSHIISAASLFRRGNRTFRYDGSDVKSKIGAAIETRFRDDGKILSVSPYGGANGRDRFIAKTEGHEYRVDMRTNGSKVIRVKKIY